MADVVLELPDGLRGDLKEPLGPLFTDAASLLASAGDPLVAVGDIVTYHLLQHGRVPAVAFVDERTEREAVDPEVRDAIGGFDRELAAANPPGTLTAALLAALRDGLDADGTTLIRVDGEEDLAALPAVLALSADGGSVCYGQPGEGMVLVTPDEETRERVRSLLADMDGDDERALSLLGI